MEKVKSKSKDVMHEEGLNPPCSCQTFGALFLLLNWLYFNLDMFYRLCGKFPQKITWFGWVNIWISKFLHGWKTCLELLWQRISNDHNSLLRRQNRVPFAALETRYFQFSNGINAFPDSTWVSRSNFTKLPVLFLCCVRKPVMSCDLLLEMN